MKEQISHSIFFSVLLVLRNEEKYIERLIQSILDQDYPKGQMEIIIVDGMSTDATLDIVHSYVAKYPKLIKVFQNDKKTLPTGWNLGIQAAAGNYILRIDGHTDIPKDFLTSYSVTINKQPNASCVGGIIISKGRGFWGKVNEHIYSHPFGVGRSKFRTMQSDWEGFVETVPYGAYKKEVFDKIGYFNEDLKRNEDIEFHKRVEEAGGTFYMSTSIRSTYYVRDSLKGLIDKSMGDGTWSMIANRMTPGSLSLFKKVPLYAFIGGILLFIGSFFHVAFLGLLLTAIIGYGLLDVYFSLQIAKQKGISYLIPCMLAFFCMHFFRGLGSFIAYFKKEYWTLRK
ncbi:glycosyltransferase family 2 protein [Alkalihalophilus sp. As8PL]|uniref:Glycosyltransferase family 2 protein n=1 Tax=Alkalihalophilus sp. As8PL TaxID=3237103 RepID=A0AB39BQN7_9BACI